MDSSQIQAKYLVKHKALGPRNLAADKAEFNKDHDKIWADCNAELEARYKTLAKKSDRTPAEQAELHHLKVNLLLFKE